MKIKWIGQAGLLIEANGKIILVDPYLSNSVEAINPNNYRRVPVDKSLLNIKPDIIVLTHNHLDHTDPETLKHYLGEDSHITVLASGNAWQEVRKFGGTRNNYVMFNRHTIWSEGDIIFKAVKAEHSDTLAIGLVMCYNGKKVYIAGDTLYNEGIFADIPSDIDVAFLPINGVGNNMNISDAIKFAKRIGAKRTVPVHFGMFDALDPRAFECNGVIIPSIYNEIACI